MLDKKELLHLEKLSKIKITEDRETEYIVKLSKVIAYIGELKRINTAGVKPVTLVTGIPGKLREDIVIPGLTQKEALSNAMHTYKGYFKVPLVIE